MLFDDTINMQSVLLRIAAFFRDESCGQCVPCRVGTVRQEELLHRLVAGRPIGSADEELHLLNEVGQAMRDASICGLGQTASSAIEIRCGSHGAIQRKKLLMPPDPENAVEEPTWQFFNPVPRGPLPTVPQEAPKPEIELTIDGKETSVPAGTTCCKRPTVLTFKHRLSAIWKT